MFIPFQDIESRNRQKGGNLSRALSRLILSAMKCPSQDHMVAAQEDKK